MSQRTVQWRSVVLFWGLVMVLTHGVSVAFVLSGGSWQSTAWVWLAQVLMLVPGVVAILLQRFVFHQPVLGSLAIRWRPNRWFLVAWLLPPVLAFVTAGLSLLLPWTSYDPTMVGVITRHVFTQEQLDGGMAVAQAYGLHPLFLFALTGLVLGPTFSLVGGLGEEIGWRGFVYHHLEPLGFWRSALVTGVLWGTWHVPQVLMGHLDFDNVALGALVMLVFVILYTPLFQWIRLRSGSSVAAALFHGVGNASMMIAIAPVQGGTALSVGIGSLTFCGLLVLVNLSIYLFDGRVGRRAPLGRKRSATGTSP